MTWIRRYRVKHYVRSCLWIGPTLAVVAGWLARILVRAVDARTEWTLLNFDAAGARDVANLVAGAMLTFAVFLLSLLLVAVQIASSQLSPRVIAGAYRDRVVRRSVSYFTFAFIFAAGTQARAGTEPFQLSVLCSILLSAGGLIMIFRVVDHVGKSLRPVSVVTATATKAADVIHTVYPRSFDPAKPSAAPASEPSRPSCPPREVCHTGRAGVLLAFDAPGLVQQAAAANCVICIVPAVGDFVADSDLLFRVLGLEEGQPDLHPQHSVALGAERTLEQDPAFALRIIVDVASRALSPAVNDPTTAVVAIDQIHRLLLRVGRRDLGDGRLADESGTVRLIFPTPNWEDFVALGVSEIRQFGAGSVQVLRRLRAMLEHLLQALPDRRHEPLRTQLSLLDEAAARNFPDTWDRQAACVGDYQGLGGRRADQ